MKMVNILGRQILSCGLIMISACSVTPLRIRPQGELPSIGTTLKGQKIFLGGFSSLVFRGEHDGKLRFLTITDRGPNADPDGNKRPFLLPDYHPMIVEILVDEKAQTYTVVKQIELMSSHGVAYSGLPQARNDEIPVDLHGKDLTLSYGIDSESLSVDAEGNFWVGEEGGPSIISFDPQGKERLRWNPGDVIPIMFGRREHNKGFEGLFVYQERVYAFLQSPLKDETNALFVEIEIKNPKQSKIWLYPFDSKTSDKIGDATVSPSGRIFVMERDDSHGPLSSKKVYEISFSGADKVVSKKLVLDLAKSGYPFEKAEGIAFIDDHRLAVVNDNDFALDGALDPATGIAKLKDEVPEIWIFKLD